MLMSRRIEMIRAELSKHSTKLGMSPHAGQRALFQPVIELEEAVRGLWHGLQRMGFDDPDYRDSNLARLTVLRDLRGRGLLNENLQWTGNARVRPLR